MGLNASASDIKMFTGGTILTVDEQFSEAEAIAIEGTRIIAVGSLDEVKSRVGDQAEVINLNGRTMLPGFVDPHAHVVTFAPVTYVMENIGMTKFRTTAEALAHLKEIAAQKNKGEWILASQWDPSVQEGVSALTLKELDAISTDHPIFVLNASGHLAYVNSKAYEAAGIPADVKNPEGAEYVRDEDGKLNGVILNNVAFLPVVSASPDLAELNMEDAIISLLQEFNKYGITTTSELSLGAFSASATETDLIFGVSKREDITARIRAYLMYTLNDDWTQAGTKMNDGNSLVKIVGIKLIADGSNQGFTGLQREPYFSLEQSTNTGLAYMTVFEMFRISEQRAQEGWHLALHGNGDQAIDNILTVMEKLKRDGFDMATIRPRIEHCSILHDEQIDKMEKLGVSASFLIAHVHYWGTWMRDVVFGPEKVQLLDRCKTTEDHGINYTLQSDFAVSEPDMLKMIDIAVNRDTFKEPEYVLAPQERISVESAIRAVTINAAWQLMSEDEIGSLEPGKFADFVILDQDPRKVDPATIEDIAVIETWMNGKMVYQAQ
ncbi:MAG: amidohydrolase [Desulfobulbaceae bacterium]|nr:MAG: amidohydrolase [Desulfobulbaceae bacterium]